MDKPLPVKLTYQTIWIIAKKDGQFKEAESRSQEGTGAATSNWRGPLCDVPDDRVIFFWVRGRPPRQACADLLTPGFWLLKRLGRPGKTQPA
jgi:hypothetical protein